MSGDLTISRLSTARKALAEAKTAQSVKQVADIAKAAEVYAKRQGLAQEIIDDAHAIHVDALRKLGEILKNPATPKAKGGGDTSTGSRIDPVQEPPTLADVGIDKHTADTARKLADLPDKQFDAVRDGTASISQAKRVVANFHIEHPRSYVGWSGGKDSTAMMHLIRVACGIDIQAVSVRDDLDFPGDEDYVRGLAVAWSVRLDVLRCPLSYQDWLAAHPDLDPSENVLTSPELRRNSFFKMLDEYRAKQKLDAAYAGMRADESIGRRANARFHGTAYLRADGLWMCQPLAWWSGLDVMGYLLSHDIDPHPVYRCLAFDARDPSRLRDNGWLPGTFGSWTGRFAWLRRYYPSLHRRLCEILPTAARYA